MTTHTRRQGEHNILPVRSPVYYYDLIQSRFDAEEGGRVLPLSNGVIQRPKDNNIYVGAWFQIQISRADLHNVRLYVCVFVILLTTV